MRKPRQYYRNLKQLPGVECLVPGSPLCAGCGGLTTVRLMHKVIGKDLVIVNAAGCMTLLSVFPFTPLKSSWLYTTMGSASAGAQGVRDALDILLRKHEIPPDEDLQVLVLAGDGSTMDMGLSATSAAIHRQLDFWYLCYDNEAYGNTGFQSSAASPWGSRTATDATGVHGAKKDLFEVWRSQAPPYLATVSSHEPLDLAEKVERARGYEGPKLFHALAVCPTGWGFDPRESDNVARLAVATGVWPLKEAVHGKVEHTLIPARLLPVEEYLRPQKRFRHLFEPRRQVETLAHMQQRVDAYWQSVRQQEADARSDGNWRGDRQTADDRQTAGDRQTADLNEDDRRRPASSPSPPSATQTRPPQAGVQQ